MVRWFGTLVGTLRSCLRTHRDLALENLALRQQLAVWKAREPRPRLTEMDRIFWVFLSRLWTSWRHSLLVVRPETVIGWHRQGFRRYWAWKSRRRSGRPLISTGLRDLIRRMSYANPLWGAPRIHGELLKLGLTVSQATVSKYMIRPRRPPSQVWRTFLKNHAKDLIALDLFTVPTRDLSGVVRARDPDPQPAPAGAFQCHGASDCGMDGTPTARDVRAGGGAPVPDSGSRPSLWRTIFASGQGIGHPRSGNCAPLALAKRVRRAGDWLDSSGMP